MIVRFGMAPRRVGLSVADFQAHWRTRHGEIAGRLPGVRRYWQNHAVLRDDEPLLPWVGFDACSQFEFDSIQSMDAAFASDAAKGDLPADEAYLVDKPNGGLALTEQIGSAGEIDLKRIRLMTFLRCAPQRSTAALGSAILSLPKASGARAREVFLALEGRQAAQRISIFDAVDIQWFDTPEAALRYAVSAEAREQRHALGDLVRGTERLIASVHVII